MPEPVVIGAGLRRYLFITAAITGAIVLIVEILGAKMLAPYLGTSHFVWTAQIGVTLLSLATGYYFGGWLVDRSQNLSNLYFCILGAALYLSGTIFLTEKVAYACLQFRLAFGTILASLFLFFVPLTLLAAVGPFLIRALTQSVQGVGGLAGRLSAVSTLGSVSGTVLIGYVLIPLLPNSVTMLCSAGILLLITLIYFVVWARKGKGLQHSALVTALALWLGVMGVQADINRKFAGYDELLKVNSDFGQLQVMQDQNSGNLIYLNDFLWQNTYDPEKKQSVSLFTYMLHGLARVYREKLDDVLCIGLGVGIVPMEFARDGSKVDAIEINQAVVPVGQKYFGLDTNQLSLHIGDGRQYLNAVNKTYDAVILDAFLGDSSPSHLMTKEAFTAIQHRLKPGGVLVINSFGDFTPGKDFFTASLDKTLKAVFKHVRIHHAGSGNVFFVATDTTDFKMVREPDYNRIEITRILMQARSAYASNDSPNPEHGMVLTDDYNPAEFHDAANREEMRRRLALFMEKR
jgi:spermidine synthase